MNSEARDPQWRGTNQSGMRNLNERLVLSLVREHGALAKTDIARMTGLSAQTVSVIMRELEAEELLLRNEPLRGKVGQPLVPMSLNPEGALFLGLKIGRRSADLVLIDFLGRVRAMVSSTYAYPTPDQTLAFVRDSIAQFEKSMTARQCKRIAGLGIAMPSEIWNWADAVGAPREIMDQWRSIDIRAAIAAELPYPVYLENDATAACGAELAFGQTRARNFVYLYVGAFIGGGIVLDGALYAGPSGNAGALGSMPVPGPDASIVQLIDVASIAILERSLIAAGRDTGRLWTSPSDWGDLSPFLERWIDEAAASIAHSLVACAAVIDFEAAVIDGWLPAPVRSALVNGTHARLARYDVEGLTLPTVREGTVGIHARSLGGASLPLSERFLLRQSTSARIGSPP